MVDWALDFAFVYIFGCCQLEVPGKPKGAALLLGQFAATDPECKVQISVLSDSLWTMLHV